MEKDIDVSAIRARHRNRIENDPNRRGDLFRRIMTDSVLHDYKIISADECDKDVDLSHRPSTVQIAKDCLSMHNLSTRGTRAEIVSRALRMDNRSSFVRSYSSDSFPAILDAIGQKSLSLGFSRAPEVWPYFVRETTTKNFLPFTRITSPELPTPDAVPEGGEITRPQLGSDSKETASLGAYPFLISLSRQAVISDDLNALTVTAEAAGRAASRKNGDLVFGVLTDNADMADSVALFDAAHGNLGTPGGPSATTLNEFRNLMASQTGPSGEVLNVRLQFLIGPPELESAMVALSDQGAVPDALTPGYRAGQLSVLTDARLSGTGFFGCADPALHSGIDLVSLEGSERPLLERQTVFYSDDIQYKILHDVTAMVVDHRTLTFNVGA